MVKSIVKVVGFGVLAVIGAGVAKASLKESGKALAPMFAGIADSLSERIDQHFEESEEETESEEVDSEE